MIAIAMIAAALGACGVKGDLDPPGVAAADPAAETKTQSGQKVFTEQSVVRRAASPSVIPNMPPDEWKKDRNSQPASQPATRDKSRPDEPFFLDKLL
jgi:predicted small lipoprotein YifL